MANILYKQIDDTLRGAARILLCTDIRIDGDTIGSTLGMMHILEMQKKECIDVYSSEALPASLEFVPGISRIIRDSHALRDKYDAICIFDSSDGLAMSRIPAHIVKDTPVIVFDHHNTNPRYGTINLIETEAASTGDVVYRFLKEMKYGMTKEAAQCLLTAICTDTNAFYTSNTTHACIEAAHELMSYGAKMQSIILHTMKRHSPELLRLWGLALERLHTNKEHDILTTAITQKDLAEYGVDDVQASLLSEFIHALVANEDSIMVLRETSDGCVKGSLRSNGRDISLIAKKYGGGGHKMASGLKVEHAHLEEKNGEWLIVNN
jgi:phosphoesterase RecJ-like protein